MGQRETDTNVITLTFGSKLRRFLEPIGNSASLLLVSKVKGQDSTLAIVALQRLEFHFLDRPRSSVLRKGRGGLERIFSQLFRLTTMPQWKRDWIGSL